MKDGWHWPEKDLKCWNWLQQEKDLPQQITNRVNERRVMIQAGGNCGFYTKLYAEMFDTVYTFEPDTTNFYCLVLNLQNHNVYKQQACIGDKHQLVAISSSKKNVGCYAVNITLKGQIPTLLIDDLELTVCDLIHLDIEGWEFPALRGAVETIKRCRPVIALEWMNHGSKFGFSHDEIENWLEQQGYETSENIMNERIFFPK